MRIGDKTENFCHEFEKALILGVNYRIFTAISHLEPIIFGPESLKYPDSKVSVLCY